MNFKKITKKSILLFLIILIGCCYQIANAQSLIDYLGIEKTKENSKNVRVGNIQVSLISNSKFIIPGKSFSLGLKIIHDDGWHTYWVNPGDSGLATKIKLSFSELNSKWVVGDIQWPTPKKIMVGPLVNYGYESEILLIKDLIPPENLKSENVIIDAKVNWLVCKEVCIPGEKKLKIKLPVKKDQTIVKQINSIEFQKTRENIPLFSQEKSNKFLASFNHEEKNLELLVKKEVLKNYEDFLPVTSNLVNPSSKIVFFEPKNDFNNSDFVIKIKLSNDYKDSLDNLIDKKLLRAIYFEKGNGVHELRIPIVNNSIFPITEEKINKIEEKNIITTQKQIPVTTNNSLMFIFFAFLGGIILNLMPCVFPILGIKVLSIIDSSKSRLRVISHAIGFSMGVLTFIISFAVFFLILRESGQILGWGFQLQNPFIVLFLLLLFLIISINLFGFFEFGSLFTRLGKYDTKNGFGGSFLMGLLTVIVATPCTAPFMGSAIGYAVTANTYDVLFIFISLGIGIAFPYFTLSIFPNLIALLPKPGIWMIKFRQFLAFPMLISSGWLLWVFIELQGTEKLLHVWVIIILILLSLWVWKSFLRKESKNIYKFIVIFILIFLLFLKLFLLESVIQVSQTELDSKENKNLNNVPIEEHNKKILNWQKWTPGLPEKISNDGKFVFVDFTASWCITCQANKLRVIDSPEIKKFFLEKNVVLVRADWTKPNKLIENEIQKFNRLGIPLNIIYFPDERKPVVLPEWLNKNQILDIISGQ